MFGVAVPIPYSRVQNSFTQQGLKMQPKTTKRGALCMAAIVRIAADSHSKLKGKNKPKDNSKERSESSEDELGSGESSKKSSRH